MYLRLTSYVCVCVYIGDIVREFHTVDAIVYSFSLLFVDDVDVHDDETMTQTNRMEKHHRNKRKIGPTREWRRKLKRNSSFVQLRLSLSAHHHIIAGTCIDADISPIHAAATVCQRTTDQSE